MSGKGCVCAAGRLKQAAALYKMSPKSLSPGQRGGRTILMSLVLKPKPQMTSFGLASAKALHEVVWAGLSEDFVTGVHNVLKAKNVARVSLWMMSKRFCPQRL